MKQNKDYNSAPGRLISGVHLEQIYVTSGSGEETSRISGYDERNYVENIEIKGFFRDGVRTENLEQANIAMAVFSLD